MRIEAEDCQERPKWSYWPISYTLKLNGQPGRLGLPVHKPLILTPYYRAHPSGGYYGVDILGQHRPPIDILANFCFREGYFTENWQLKPAIYAYLSLDGNAPPELESLRRVPLFSYQPGLMRPRIMLPGTIRNQDLLLTPNLHSSLKRAELWFYAKSLILR